MKITALTARMIVSVLTLPLVLLAAPFQSDRFQPADHKVEVDCDLQVRWGDRTEVDPAFVHSEVGYSVEHQSTTESIAVNSVITRFGSGKAQVIESKLDSNGASFQLGEREPIRYTLSTAPPTLGELLADLGRPAVCIAGDPTGSAPSIQISERSPIVRSGVLDLIAFSRPPFRESDGRWVAEQSLSLGTGLQARGPLTYEKAGAGPDDTIRVEARGTLESSGKMQGSEIRRGTYEVRGELFYSPEKSTWRSGQYTVKISFEISRFGVGVGSGTGVMTLKHHAINSPH